MSGRTLNFIGAGLIVASVLAGCTPAEDIPASVSVAQAAPDFELDDLTGKKVRLSDFKGKVVLVDFWATYCLPCHEAIPELQALQDKFRDKGLEVVGISVDAYTGHVPEFVAEHGMKYAVVLDPDQSTAKSYGFSQLPTTFLIGRDGKIIRKWLGYDNAIGEEIRTQVAASLG